MPGKAIFYYRSPVNGMLIQSLEGRYVLQYPLFFQLVVYNILLIKDVEKIKQGKGSKEIAYNPSISTNYHSNFGIFNLFLCIIKFLFVTLF